MDVALGLLLRPEVLQGLLVRAFLRGSTQCVVDLEASALGTIRPSVCFLVLQQAGPRERVRFGWRPLCKLATGMLRTPSNGEYIGAPISKGKLKKITQEGGGGRGGYSHDDNECHRLDHGCVAHLRYTTWKRR